MKSKHAESAPPRLPRFVAGWGLLIFPAMLLSAQLDLLIGQALGAPQCFVAFQALLAGMQLLWVRRHFRLRLPRWVVLAAAGALVGALGNQALWATVDYPFPPWLYYGGSQRMPEAEWIMQLKYALFQNTRALLLWSLPLLFQWLALRRFAGHRLWLLAAFVQAPLHYASMEDRGLLLASLRFLRDWAGLDVTGGAPLLGGLALFADWALPGVVMGAILCWILRQPLQGAAAGKLYRY